MNRYIYRLRGKKQANDRNSKGCGSSTTYDKAVELAKKLIKDNLYEQVIIERIQTIKTIKKPKIWEA